MFQVCVVTIGHSMIPKADLLEEVRRVRDDIQSRVLELVRSEHLGRGWS